MSGLRAGKFDQRITIQEKTATTDGYGQRINTWSTYATLWADFFQKDGMEMQNDDNRSTKRMINFKTRYQTGLNVRMRIIYNGEYYKIEDLKEIRRKQGWIIMTSLLTQT